MLARTVHDYIAYGLRIRSALELPELVAQPSHPASSIGHPLPNEDIAQPAEGCEVLVRLDRVEPPPHDAIALDAARWVKGRSMWRYYEAACRMFVHEGREIVIEPAPGADERALRLVILGNGLGALLHQRGLLVLHASSVAIAGLAVVFPGFSGAGKSTMAAALNRRGHPLVADDVVAVRAEADNWLVLPAFPQVKLYPEAAESLGHDIRTLTALHPELTKLGHRAVVGFSPCPLRLGAIYMLDAATFAAPRTMRMAAGEAVIELVRQSYATSLFRAQPEAPVPPTIDSTQSLSAQFLRCANLLRLVPVYKVTRGSSLAALNEVAREIERRTIECFFPNDVR